MKRHLLILAGIATALMMVSCKGGNKSAAEGAEETVEEATEFNGEMFSKEAVQFYVKNFKLKFKDIEADYAYDDSNKYNFAGEARQIAAGFPVKEGESFTDEQYNAFVTKIYNATKAVADNGICVNGFEKKDNKDEAMAEYTLEEALAGTTVFGIRIDDASWAFLLDGKFNVASVSKLSAGNGCMVKIYEGLQKSFNETMEDAEKVLEEIDKDPAKKAAVEKEVDKALKEAGLK